MFSKKKHGWAVNRRVADKLAAHRPLKPRNPSAGSRNAVREEDYNPLLGSEVQKRLDVGAIPKEITRKTPSD
jgi:hypothetical protein